jgi:hypothetical protein
MIQKDIGSTHSPENVRQRKEHTQGADNGHEGHEYPSVDSPFALRICHLHFSSFAIFAAIRKYRRSGALFKARNSPPGEDRILDAGEQ